MNHPVLARRGRLSVYLLLWLAMGGLIAAPALFQGCTVLESAGLALPMAVLGAGIGLLPFFIARVMPAGRTPLARLSVVWLIAAVVDGAFWAAAGSWISAHLLSKLPGLERLPAITERALPFLWAFGVLLYLAYAAFYYLLLAQDQAEEAERARLQMQMLAQEAELKALRAQLNPHFLFNALNSISALTSLDPPRARDMCVKLSDFLRRALGLGERASVALAEELELSRGYLAIEQVRFGQRLRLDWQVDPAAEAALLPPLLLQPLVENAIKHGISPLPEGGEVRLEARLEAGVVHILVENPMDPDAPAPKGLGLGLRQVRQRLLGRFGEAAFFEALPGEGRHAVRLRFPFRTEEP
ncbi:MAG TPA: histidine kinase [Holophagaceae bacterium]|nr:histidine kinase [Holophagaceae bacterium]